MTSPWFLLVVAFPCGALLLALLWQRKGQRFDAKGKRILITGASSGIGLELSLLYAREGASLLLTSRQSAVLEKCSARCLEVGAAAVAVVSADLATAEGSAAVAESAAATFPTGLDLCVLNAGLSMGTSVQELVASGEAKAVFRQLMEVNYFGSIDVLCGVLPLLLRAPCVRVCVVNSVVGLSAPPTRSGYAASKAALRAFANSLRCELAEVDGHPCVITQAYPGAVRTGINERRLGSGARNLEFANATPASTAAQLIAGAVAAGRRDLYMSIDGTAMGLLKLHALRLISLVSPSFADGLMAKEVRRLANAPSS